MLVSVLLEETRQVSTRLRKRAGLSRVQPDRSKSPESRRDALVARVLDSNVQLRDVQCMTGQNGGQ